MKTYTLKKIKELCEKASPSPWRGDFKCDAQKHEIYSGIYQTSHKIADVINYPRDFLPKEVEKADFGFIAASREIIPQLVGQLEKAIEALRFYANPKEVVVNEIWNKDMNLNQQIIYAADTGGRAQQTLKELGVE